MAQTQPVQAEIPPHEPKKSNVVQNYKTLSGFEGREAELGKSLNVMLRTLSNTAGYAHEINDALVKMHLMAMQFAKDEGKIDEWVAHDVKTMSPINSRMANIIRKTGQKEIALVGLFESVHREAESLVPGQVIETGSEFIEGVDTGPSGWSEDGR